MLESTVGKVSVSVQPTTFLGDVAVSVCFKADVAGCVMGKLNGTHAKCSALPKGTDAACAAYALYLAVQDKMCGNPLAAKNSKVGKVSVGAHNGHVFFSWNMKGTVSHVRKAVSLCMSVLKPGSLYSLYSHCIKRVGGKPNKEHFNHAAHVLIAGLNAGVSCCIIGKVKIDQAKVKDIATKTSKKLSPGTAATPQTENKATVPCDMSNVTELKVSGWQAYVTKDYIMSKARGVEPFICEKSVVVPMKSSSYDSLKKRLKKNVDLFVKQKYAKLGDECGSILAYLALSNASLSCDDAKKLCKAKVSDIKSAINSSL